MQALLYNASLILMDLWKIMSMKNCCIDSNDDAEICHEKCKESE